MEIEPEVRSSCRSSYAEEDTMDAVALPANGSLMRIYRLKTASERWPVWALIFQIGIPAAAALVAARCSAVRAATRRCGRP